MRVLDWLNVFLADVRAGIGPCLAVYLLTTYNAAGDDIGFRVAEPVFPTGVGRALRKKAQRSVGAIRLEGKRYVSARCCAEQQHAVAARKLTHAAHPPGATRGYRGDTPGP